MSRVPRGHAPRVGGGWNRSLKLRGTVTFASAFPLPVWYQLFGYSGARHTRYCLQLFSFRFTIMAVSSCTPKYDFDYDYLTH